MWHTVRAGRDTCRIRYRLDGAQALGGLFIRHCNAALDKDSGEVLVLAITRLEGAILRSVGGVVLTSDTVVYVLAEVRGVGSSGVTGFEAELVGPHEAGDSVKIDTI
jgi:hypothetical protein